MDFANPKSPAPVPTPETTDAELSVDGMRRCLYVSASDNVDELPVRDPERDGSKPISSSFPKQRPNRGCVESECCISPMRNLRLNNTQGGLIKSCTPIEEKAPRPPREPQPRESPVLVRRPGKGKDGTQVDLCVNYFPVNILDKNMSIFHYEVELEPPSRSEELNRKLKSLLQEEFFGEFIAYDGYQNLYIAEHTALQSAEFAGKKPVRFHVGPWFGGRVYQMTVTRVNEIRARDLLDFLSGNYAVEVPKDCLQALETVVRDSLCWAHCAVGRYLYHSGLQPVALELDLQEDYSAFEVSASVWGLPGFSQKLRPVECGLALNVNSSARPFHARKCVPHYLQGRGIDPKMLLLDEETLRSAKEILAGLYVDVIDRISPRKFKIVGISHTPAKKNELFDKTCQREMSMAEYFERKSWTMPTDPDLPCLIVTGGGDAYESDPFHVPMGGSLISKGQLFNGDLPNSQHQRLLKFQGGDDPSERYRRILLSCRFATHYLHQPREIDDKRIRSINPFGLRLEENMISMTGRVLDPPALSNILSNHPRGGKWKLLKVYNSGRVLSPNQWCVIVFGLTDPDRVMAMVGRVIDICNSIGIRCFGHRLEDITYHWQFTASYLEKSDQLERYLESMKYSALKEISFLLCVIDDGRPDEAPPFYGHLERLCETRFGWLTQCCYSTRLDAIHDEYARAVALRCNALLGGTNNALRYDFGTIFQSVFRDQPVIIFGARVTVRPAIRREDQNVDLAAEWGPRGRKDDAAFYVVAVVASMDWPHPSQYSARVMLGPRQTAEQLARRMSQMVEELMAVHVEKNGGRKPQRAVFFRYGVEDVELWNLLDGELRGALTASCPGLKATWLSVGIDTDIKFFRKVQRGSTAMADVKVGTVVDSHVVHPWQWDFYLASHTRSSHGAITEPAHYRVLDDENGFTADDIQKFVYYLCHTFAGSTKTLDVVPPVYYAKLAVIHTRSNGSTPSDKPTDEVINTMYFLM